MKNGILETREEFIKVGMGEMEWESEQVFLTSELGDSIFRTSKKPIFALSNQHGWVSVPNPEDYSNFDQDWNRGTLAWETGTGPAALIHGFKASLDLLHDRLTRCFNAALHGHRLGGLLNHWFWWRCRLRRF